MYTHIYGGVVVVIRLLWFGLRLGLVSGKVQCRRVQCAFFLALILCYIMLH